jgi:uncharacterized Zn finger protein
LKCDNCGKYNHLTSAQAAVIEEERKVNRIGKPGKYSARRQEKAPQGTDGYSSKVCYSCGGDFPHKGGRKACSAFGLKCDNCGKYNHLTSAQAAVIEEERKVNRIGKPGKYSARRQEKAPQGTDGYSSKVCYSCGGDFPHKGGRKACSAFGLKCDNCGKYNHLTSAQAAVIEEERKVNRIGKPGKYSARRQEKVPQGTDGYSSKVCYSCGGDFPHKGGRKACSAFGLKCDNCGKYNHLTSAQAAVIEEERKVNRIGKPGKYRMNIVLVHD